MSAASKRRGLAALSLAVAAGGGVTSVVSPAQANPAGTGLVISEVFGGGGNAGAPYKSDFIELYNPTTAPIALSGTSIQYRSASGGSGGSPVALSGSVAPKGYFLIKAADGSNAAAPALPAADATTTFNMSASEGQVLLINGASFTGSGNVAGNPALVDMVAYGATPTTFEGASGPGLSSTTSAQRNASGTDTDNNAADLTAAAPTPLNSSSSTGSNPGGSNPGGNQGTPPPGGDQTVIPIAEIQGTNTPTSPRVGQSVTTEGVVTALYRTGGYNGMYIQTGGTGGATDTTPGASDAVFVYGANSMPADVAIGDSVRVNGPVSEYNGTTEITPAAGGVTKLASPLPAVTPAALAYPTGEAGREAHEGELLAPTDTLTVTNTYSTNQYGEIGLATGTKPLIVPTEVARVQDGAAIAAATADNVARGVVLDDGAATNFLGDATAKSIPLPWLSKSNPIRVGARVTLKQPVILEFRNNAWKFQPRQQVTDDGATVAAVENTRPANQAPAAVGGNVSLSSFNVLNYFTQTAALAGCTSTYNDRAGNPITANSCGTDGVRGAANDVSLQRQQIKIVKAINTLDASIVSLEEIENSVKYGKDRDQALQTLVNALNADAGSTRWALVPSPPASGLPATSAQDIIRNAFIYQPAQVALVGTSKVLVGSTAFSNARQPLAQGFKAVGEPDSKAFTVVTNHFKSKGSGVDDGTGQGLSNPDRVAQAGDLVSFAQSFSASLGGSGAIFLSGDFNSYTMEDPMQVLYGKGYENLAPSDKYTYSYGGQSGSLDHVLANAAGKAMVSGSDIWNINSGESIAFEYSRYNYNASDLYEPNQFRASDHDPIKVGLKTGGALAAPVAPVSLNLLNINDFHGRIDANTTKFATTVERLRAEGGEANTLFLSDGDNIGASLFASAIDKDQATIDVLGALGLQVSAVGNHEFDQGFDDLTGRVQKAASFDYLGANVYLKGTQTPALPEYRILTVGGVKVAVVGAVTVETPTLVSPAGVAKVDFGDPVAAVNRVAAQLSDGNPANGEAQVIVAEYHEGAGANLPDSATCAQEIAADTAFGRIARDTSATVDAIFTGHTHKTYACDGPIPGADGRTRPILQTGSYGENIGQVRLVVDPTTGDVTTYTQRNVARATTADLSLPRVQQVKTITDAAIAKAAKIGDQKVGTISSDITTAFSGGSFAGGAYAGGSRDDRASESTLGDLVAQALYEGVSGIATPDLGITNPGGLRAELTYKGDTSTNPANTDGVVTYAEANAVLPFNNTVAIVKLTGAQLRSVLEQQWQTNADGTIPSRPYLQLGLSSNVRVTADPTAPTGSRITSVRINGQLIDPAKTYTVSTLSFLAAGGDNFRAFTQGSYVDTGLLDAQLWRDYLAASSPVAPDFARQQVEAPGMPSAVVAGQKVSFTLNKLNLTSSGSPANTGVTVWLTQGTTSRRIGSYAVTNGSAPVSFTAPATLGSGEWSIGVQAAPSGTQVGVDGDAPNPPSLSGTVSAGGQPVPGACVYLYTSRTAASASFASCSDSAGAFTVADVTPGRYAVAVTKPSGGYETQWLAQPVDLTSSAVTGLGITLAELGFGRITGAVTEAGTNGALSGMCVFAYPHGTSAKADFATCSAGDGAYAMYKVTSAAYDLAFFDPTGMHPTQWWNGSAGGATTQAGAAALAVPGGDRSVAADAVMALRNGVAQGKVVDARGTGVAGVCVYLYDSAAGPARYGTCTQADGTWYLPNVLAGTYKIAFADPQNRFAVQWWNDTTAGASTYAGGRSISLISGDALVANATVAPRS